MRVLKAIYEKPRHEYETQGWAWEFVASTDADLPHGHPCFGGVLRKAFSLLKADGGWQAKCHSAENFAAPAKDRLTAIQNCVEDTIRVFTEWRREQEQEKEEEKAARANAEKKRRKNAATILAALRLFQNYYMGRDAATIRHDWPEHFADVDPLSAEEIDTLCEEINSGNAQIV